MKRSVLMNMLSSRVGVSNYSGFYVILGKKLAFYFYFSLILMCFFSFLDRGCCCWFILY